MVQFSPTTPSDLRAAFNSFDTKKFSQKETIDLFKRALQHVGEITFIDKEKFIAEIAEEAKSNPELQRLAIKILFEAGRSDIVQIEEKINALPEDPNFISALKNIPERDFDKFLNILDRFDNDKKTKLIKCVSKLNPEEGELVCLLAEDRMFNLLGRSEDLFLRFFNNARYAVEGMTDSNEKANLLEDIHSTMLYISAAKSSRFKENVGSVVNAIEDLFERTTLVISLLRVPNDERDEIIELSLTIMNESHCGIENLSTIIDELQTIPKDSRRQIAKVCPPLLQLIDPSLYPKIFPCLRLFLPEEMPSLVNAAKILQNEKFHLTPLTLTALSKLPLDKLKEILSLIKKCTPIVELQEEILYLIATANNKEEITQILKLAKQALDLRLKGLPPVDAYQIVQAIKLVPAPHREAAIASAAEDNYESGDWRILLFGCFSSAYHEKLSNLASGLPLNERLQNDPQLQDEFTKNMLTMIQDADKEDMASIISFLDQSSLWQPFFAEVILKKDMTQLKSVIDKGFNAEIIRYLKTDEGLLQIAEVLNELSVETSVFVFANLKEEETAIKNAAAKVGVESIENIATPEVFNYIKENFLFISPKPHLTTSQGHYEPLSEEAKKELLQVINAKEHTTKKDWKNIVLSSDEINSIRPHFNTLIADVIASPPRAEDREEEINGKTVTLYKEELEALYLYTSENYLLINGVLDNDATSLDMWCKDKFKKHLKDLTTDEKQKMETAILALDVIFHFLASAINKTPVETNPIYRGDAIATTELASWQKGKVFSTSKFFSCSVHPAVSEHFAKSNAVDYMRDKKVEYRPVLYIIDSKSSHNISYFSANEPEDERIYLPHQSFQVLDTDQTTQPGLTLIYLREVDPEEIETL